MVPASGYLPESDTDARLVGAEDPLPLSVIIDYILGASAYNFWKCVDSVREVTENYFPGSDRPVWLELRDDPPHDGDDIPDTGITPESNEHGEGSQQGFLNSIDEMNFC